MTTTLDTGDTLGVEAECLDDWDIADYGTETVPGAQLRRGDLIDDPHRPRQITDFEQAPLLEAVLGPGSRIVRCGHRTPRPVAGDEPVTVLLPRPEAD